ncbi:PAS domain-containing sensor histidine kinase [Nitratireductor sp. ZSWI3]|uniref:sensor histidine kinase n=1 Tax=Nitratireductor sp. ZSWI3 TaxID=2966359 RepID=UPI00214FA800|nr:PAS domain-containing sensor histidine kinase [Nitratireductor sp. ZSWI3]MCR4265699.1 PAS-domain containing protein [Nitratireductor sp. ZSWI3]
MPGLDPLNGGSAGPKGRQRKAGLVRGKTWLLALATTAATPLPAAAQAAAQSARGLTINTLEVIQLSIFAGIMGAAFLSAIWLIRQRARIAAENLELRARVAELGGALGRSEALLNLKDQRTIVWGTNEEPASIVGELPVGSGAPEERSAFLAFGRWMTPRSASAIDRAVEALRKAGETFDLSIETRSGTLLEAQGRKAAQHTAVRFVSLSAAQQEHARLKIEQQDLSAERESIFGLLDALDMPFWLRDRGGQLTWVNRAFMGAVDAADPETVRRERREFLPAVARDEIINRHRDAGDVFRQSLSAVVHGERRVFSVTDYAGAGASAGIAADVSEMEAIRREHESTVRSHADTLDQLTTAVAIFDGNQKLRFFNQSFQKLWDLDTPFLESAPDNALFLDRLRSDGTLAEQPEWRRWKEGLLSAYRSVKPQEHWWHLPDGRTVRVIANPQPRGGVTWVFENLTEKFDLESRYNAAMRVQRETLDNLAEGVAVFGPDGRLRLFNPAFQRLWNLPEMLVVPGAHIADIRTVCDALSKESPWGGFVASVTGFDDERRNQHGQVELNNGTVLSHATIHLPNGQVMMTFVDMTDSVNVERALKEKNDALQKADKLKNDFVQHVSYELRSPLTNIIGFTELLNLPETGPLTQRQREYVDHIGSSSSVLLTVVNDILDLATVDAGIMELEIGEVRIGEMVETAAGLVAERLREHGIRLDIDMDDAAMVFHADENRVRQVLFNLLSNAANYAPEDSTIRLSARWRENAAEFCVHDDGPGMAPDVLETIFKRFEPRVNGGRRRGAGLGLSIVKSFVELHGGSVQIETGEGRGTTVTCRFPSAPTQARAAAE